MKQPKQKSQKQPVSYKAAATPEQVSDTHSRGLQPPSLQLKASKPPIQRGDKPKEGGKKGDEKSEDKPFSLGDFISEKAYEALKKELGEKKLKEHAEKIAKMAADELTKLMQGEKSEDPSLADKLQETHLKNLALVMKDHLAKEVLELMNSPEGKKVQAELLKIAKTRPDVVVGMALIGLAIAYAADTKLKGDKEFKMGKKFKGKVEGDLGSAKKIDLKTLKASLSYTGKAFKATLSGGHTKEGKKPGTSAALSMTAGKKGKTQFSSKTEVHIDPDKNFKFKLSPELKAKLFGMGGSLQYSEVDPKNWSGSVFMRIGGNNAFFKPIFAVDGQGNLVFKVDSQLLTEKYKLTSNLGYQQGAGKYSGAFGMKPKKGPGFNVSLGGDYTFSNDQVPFSVWSASAKGGYKSDNFELGSSLNAGSRANDKTGNQEYYGAAGLTATAKIAGDDKHSLSLKSSFEQNLFTPGTNLTGGLQYKGLLGATPIYINMNLGGYLVMPEFEGDASDKKAPKPFNGTISLIVPLW